MKAVAHNLKAHPRVNASLSADVTALIEKRYIHVGFAVDTEDGLLVPVIRDVDKKASGNWPKRSAPCRKRLAVSVFAPMT